MHTYNRHTANQNDFSKIPGSPIAYWVGSKIANSFSTQKVSEICDTRLGMATADNDKFLRFWHEVDNLNIGFGLSSRDGAKKSNAKWFPYQKGGEFRKWYGNYEYLVNWENDGFEIMNFIDFKTGKVRSHNYNLDYIFKLGITWNALSSSITSMRLSSNALFDNAGSSLFLADNENFFIVLSFMNMKLMPLLIKAISPTMNYQPGDIAKLPIIFPKSESTKQAIDTLTGECIDISREEWDSRETSWDFRANGLLRFAHSDGKIESAYNAYCDYWREKFYILHANEEELNRLFIDIYELQDELTADVSLDDITILKSESKIIDDELVFNADEIARQFISYAVGCMFGRYSLDREGLVVANMGQAIPTDTTFEIDDDNIIPVLEEEVFSDDIAARFERFVAVAFGEEFVGENIRWIEQSIGMDIRKYFVAEFYKDHVRRYKKRPIYWMVQSPKKGFSALIYMHRYQTDTMARVQTMYLREYLTKIDSLIEHTRSVSNNPDSSAKDAKEAAKTLTKLEAKQRDALDFDRGDMSRVAALQIPIDLDDGVKVNYQKFKGVLPDIGLSKGED
jgi:hypothetical protein